MFAHTQYYKISDAIKQGMTQVDEIGIWSEISERISDFTELESLTISEINVLPKEIGDLKKLSSFKFQNSDIEQLPDEIRNLRHIKELHLDRCENIKELPEWIYKFENIEVLTIKYCPKLLLANSIVKWKNITRISFHIKNFNNIAFTLDSFKKSNIKSLKIEGFGQMAKELWELTELHELEVSGFEDELPSDIGKFRNLQKLHYIGDINKTQKLPDEIGNLMMLEDLHIGSISKIDALPASVWNLSQIKRLSLSSLPEMTQIPTAIQNLKNLEYLNLYSFSKLEIPKEIWNLSNLEWLKLQSVTVAEKTINFLDGIGKLKKLKHLELGWINNIRILSQEVSQLDQLRYLSLRKIDNIRLPDIFSNLSKLEVLVLELDTFRDITQSFNRLKQIRKIGIISSKKIQIEKGVKFCENLEELKLLRVSQNSGNNLSDAISHLKKLRSLRCPGAELMLQNGFAFEETLSELEFNCEKEKPNLKYLKNYTKLKSLNIIGSSNIKEIPEVILNLKWLLTLNLCSTYITEIPDDIANLKALEVLNVNLWGSTDNHYTLFGESPSLKYISNKIVELKNLEQLGIFVESEKKVEDLLKNMDKEASEYIEIKKILMYDCYAGYGD